MAMLTIFGIFSTVSWIVVGYCVIIQPIGVMEFFGKGPDLIGNFLSGFFAPVAFLWLVIGYFQQGKEISQNTGALKLQHEEMVLAAKEMAAQTEALRENQQNTSIQTFLGLYSLMIEEMKNEAFELNVALGGHPKTRQDAISNMYKVASDILRAEGDEFASERIIYIRDRLNSEGVIDIVWQYVWKFDYLLEASDGVLLDRYFYRFLIESQYRSIFDLLARVVNFESHFMGFIYCSRPGET